ncbi:MAG TPA: glycine oxidase ThiO [Gemmatimonadota bacterium]|nr:glycine oxidase ThiO [Gemmatimonadota bacterium]
MERRDAIVVGGGLVGCLAARALAREGWRVRLLESGTGLGLRSSIAAAGMLSPQMEDAEELLVEGVEGVESAPGVSRRAMMDLCLAARDRYPGFVRELQAETGCDVHYRTDGTLIVALADRDADRLARAARAHRVRGLAADLLSASDARRLEPRLTERVTAGLLLPDDHQVDTVALMKAAAVAVGSRAEVRVQTRARVIEVLSAAGRVAGVRTENERIEAPVVVLAAGAWSGGLDGLPRPLGIRPVRGQMAALRPARPPIARIVGGHGAYCVPRDDGRVLIGATVEEAGFDDRVTAEGIEALVAAAREFLPVLGDAPLDSSWAGLRPGTVDSLPIIGEDPDLEGLVYATGHYRNGILLAPITAEAIAAVAAGEVPTLDLAPFRPDRHSISRPRDAG